MNMEDFRAACRRAAAGEEFKMADHKKKQLSPGARVVLYCLVQGGGRAGDRFFRERIAQIPMFYRELCNHALVELDPELEWRPTKRGIRSNEKLLASGWRLSEDSSGNLVIVSRSMGYRR